MRARRRLAVLVTTAALLLGACGGSDTSEEGAPRDVPGVTEDDSAPGVPEECVEAQLFAMGPADLAEVDKIPAGWPDPPADSVLCVTKSTADDSQETAEYATELAPAEVLDTYQASLADLGVTREVDGIGADILTGRVGDVGYQVKARDGAFSLTFSSTAG